MIKYSLKEDHAEIKKQIKTWEIEIDKLVEILLKSPNHILAHDGNKVTLDVEILRDGLEELSNEMMAINI